MKFIKSLRALAAIFDSGDAEKIADVEDGELAYALNKAADALEKGPTLVVSIDGGVVQAVFGTGPARVIVTDFDTEYTNRDQLVTIEGSSEATVDEYYVQHDPEWVAKVEKALTGKES